MLDNFRENEWEVAILWQLRVYMAVTRYKPSFFRKWLLRDRFTWKCVHGMPKEEKKMIDTMYTIYLHWI